MFKANYRDSCIVTLLIIVLIGVVVGQEVCAGNVVVEKTISIKDMDNAVRKTAVPWTQVGVINNAAGETLTTYESDGGNRLMDVFVKVVKGKRVIFCISIYPSATGTVIDDAEKKAWEKAVHRKTKRDGKSIIWKD